MRKYSLIDQLLIQTDSFLTTIWGNPVGTDEQNPSENIPEAELSQEQKKQSIALMRVNHTGEVCAQALYQSQSLYSQKQAVQKIMNQSLIEENNHLIWCKQRIEQLGGKTSILNPIFYKHSFLLGAIAGSFGDRYSLGFVVETEKQVENHLNQYINRLVEKDKKSKSILEKMRSDEIEHGQKAQNHGADELPKFIKILMNLSSKVMTKTSYYI